MTIQSNPIEYVGSIIREKDNIVIFYSVKDETSQTISIPIDKLEWKLIN